MIDLASKHLCNGPTFLRSSISINIFFKWADYHNHIMSLKISATPPL